MRASTPSNAAELAVNDIYEDLRKAEELSDRMKISTANILNRISDKYKRLVETRNFRNPTAIFYPIEMKMNNMAERIKLLAEKSIMGKNMAFSNAVSALEALSPLKVLTRGYSYTEDSDGKVVSSVKDIECGEIISVTFVDGNITAQVKDKVDFDGKKN